MKVALYARVSLDDEGKRFQDPENQLVPLRDWAKTVGHEVVREYVDKASGADGGRPAFRQMFKDAHMGDFKGVAVWKMDRFSREPMRTVLSYLDELKRRGVWVKSMTETWLDTSQENPFGEVVIAILAWVANEERRKISERTKAGINRLKGLGHWRGGRPRKRVPPEPVNVEAGQ